MEDMPSCSSRNDEGIDSIYTLATGMLGMFSHLLLETVDALVAIGYDSTTLHASMPRGARESYGWVEEARTLIYTLSLNACVGARTGSAYHREREREREEAPFFLSSVDPEMMRERESARWRNSAL